MAYKRSTKWYRKNEQEVMDILGLEQTKNSGSGWIEKADGQNENVICELKSTDSGSYRITRFDLEKLESHAIVAHKIPVFAIEFISTGEIYLLLKPERLKELAEGIKTGKFNVDDNDDIIPDYKPNVNIKQIKSSRNSREAFHEERENKYRKEKKAW